MISSIRKTFLAITGLGTLMALAIAAGHAQTGSAQAGGAQPGAAQATPAGPVVKKASEQYKNLKVLTDIPADQLGPSMDFIAASLGVRCEACHVEGAPEKDDKQMKLTARKMMQMTDDINKNSFNGRRQLTCYSCHRGAEQPVPTPILSDVETPRTPPAAPPATMPTIDQIADKYVQALGGADAIQKVTTRVEKGNILANGQTIPIELYTKAPDKRISITHTPNGDNMTAFDGTKGWMGGGRGAREMDAAGTAGAKIDATFSLATQLKQVFPRLRVVPRPEKIGDKEMYVVVNQGQPAVRLYFDEESGLLVRMVRYTDTPMGRLPVQIDYSDYRDAGGAKVPFHWTLTRVNGRFSIQIDQAQANVPIDDSKFTAPVPPGQ